jgi:CBS domain-containing protein
MMRTPVCCAPETNLGSAIELLWTRNCGMLPVVDATRKVIGVATDRDLSIAMGTRNRLPGQITVGSVMSAEPATCRPEDDIHAALQTMANRKVRRLPVVGRNGALEGILSIDDVILHTEVGSWARSAELSQDDVIKTLRQIYGPSLPQAVETRALMAPN